MSNLIETEQKIYEVIVKTIIEKTNSQETELSLEKHLFADIGLDSLSFLEFIVHLENAFDLDFEELISEVNDITINNLIKYVQSKKDAQ